MTPSFRLLRTFRCCALLLSALAFGALSGCASMRGGEPGDAYFVVLGEQGAAVARVITSARQCPPIYIDFRSTAMTVRAPKALLAQRTTVSEAANSKPSDFPVMSCEAEIPAGATSVIVARHNLPLPKLDARRIVVIGDTGCRLKDNDDRSKPGTFQDCNDAVKYPFETIARAASAWKPDLVIHVGDYHYRENACPAGQAGCQGSSWGYGWDAWRDDFFKPAASLLGAAPWVVARGNHESCSRGGQGWWRLLDPRPLMPLRDCLDPVNDQLGDYSEPYAVPLGAGAQLLVLDSSNASNSAIKPGDIRVQKYRSDYFKLDALSQQAAYNIGVWHHPMLGFFAKQEKNGSVTLLPGNAALQSVFGPINPQFLPPRVNLLLSGHTHAWEQLSFSSAHPTQFISGFSGTDEDIVPLPAAVPTSVTPAPGAVVASMSSWVDGFGFMTMEKNGEARWQVQVFDRAGKAMNSCQVDGSKSVCERAVVK